LFVVGGAIEFSRTRVVTRRTGSARRSPTETEPINNPLYYNEEIYSTIDEHQSNGAYRSVQSSDANLPSYSEAMLRHNDSNSVASELEEICEEDENVEESSEPNDSSSKDDLPSYKDIFVLNI
jgi:hypothetical protein